MTNMHNETLQATLDIILYAHRIYQEYVILNNILKLPPLEGMIIYNERKYIMTSTDKIKYNCPFSWITRAGIPSILGFKLYV